MGQEDIRVARIEEATRMGAAQAALRVAEQYLAAVRARDLHSVGKTLHPELHFTGPAGEVRGREGFLETFHQVFANLGKLDITDEVLKDNLIYFTYYMTRPAPYEPIHGTMKTTHGENGLINKIEMADHSARLEKEPPPSK